MGSSAKKKKEKKKDFQKPKLKVGKARPKNTNATDTSFSAKSIVFKQQSLSESGGRDPTTLFNHNLSLLSSKADTQRRDALVYLTTACGIQQKSLPQPVSAIVEKAQPLILDGSSQVRQQLLKLFEALPTDDLGNIERLLMYIRAGMTHLSNDIRSSALDTMDWLLTAQAQALVSCAGGWIKILRTFQNLLSWTDSSAADAAHKGWSAGKSSTNLGSNKLLVHQLRTLARFLTAGLTRPDLAVERAAAAQLAALSFPLWHTDAHLMPKKSNAFGYLNLFGAPRDAESEMYEDAEDRCEVFKELGLHDLFCAGVKEAKKEAGEVGRAAALVEKALKLADDG